MAARRYGSGYEMPGVDTPRAIANAAMFLTNARSLDNTSAEQLAHQYRLSARRAEYMLTIEKQRRAR